MYSFRNYLREASFGAGKIQRVIKLIEVVMGRRLGKIYRYDGPDGVQKISDMVDKNAFGFLYFMQNKRAFRFNYAKSRKGKGRKIVSLDIWKVYKHTKDPDFSVNVEEFNIVQILDTLADIVKNPQKGSVEVQVDEAEYLYGDTAILAEAKRVSVIQFRDIVAQVNNGKISDLTRQEIKDIARRAGVTVPVDVLQNPAFKQRRGRFTLDVNAQNMEPSAAKKSRVNRDGIELIVMGRDKKQGNRFFKPSPEQADEAILNYVNKNLSADGSKVPQDQIEREMKDVDTLFGNMSALVGMVAKGTNPSLFIYGGAGTGKTFCVNETLKNHGKVKGQSYKVVKGKVTPMGLYVTLFMNRNNLVVFDDADSAFKSEDAANILKAALDSYDEREISWVTNRTVNVSSMSPEDRAELEDEVDKKLSKGEDVKLPSSFIFNGGVIFISNLPEDKVDSAILSRSFKIDMTLTDEQMFQRIASILEYIGGREFDDINMDDKKNILRTIMDRTNQGILSNPNMRTMVAAMRIFKSGVPNWETLMEYT